MTALTLFCSNAFADDEEKRSDAAAHLLQAELALQGSEYLEAAQQYRKAAQISDSVDVARQATRVGYSFGFNEEALLAAKRWLELDEESDEALLYVAQLQLRLGDLRKARRNLKKLIERGDEGADSRLLSLVQVLSQEDPEDADKIMRWLAKPYKDSAYAQYATAVIAMQAGDTDYAEERTLRAIELDPEWTKAKLLYARTILLAGRQDEAIEYTARLIGDDPDPDPDARMELALMMMTAGRDDDALSQINQILLEQPSRADALRMMAIINFRLENLDAAWADFQDLLASGRFTMDALYYLARIADVREEHERAARLYSQVRSGPNAVVSQRRASALIAYELEDPQKALQDLEEFGTNSPSHAIDMVLARAQLLASFERYDEALDFYEKYVMYRPDDESALLGRAELLLRMDRVDDAVAQYRAAAKRWPESAMSLNALGYTLADRTDEYREAEKLIRKALEYDPDSPAIIDSLGWVLFKRGEYEAALVELERAYEKLDDHEVAAHIVDVLVALERRDDALEVLEDAEGRHSDSDLLKDVRNRLFPDAD
ncbi:MAG: tetratricopeptide repeat protein [Gammaproteobacteria bacterium]|nr:tetratricopeptide repeat protein [Gammaproteobacteria bacterium]MDH3908247.1 tetratricopeptide repeat protein [Gammaproteobacteria bacterium]MDH3953707.1 tetratricopeptide repeat protein [Gammaproteobacteria bacterium]NCF60262.1 tetratricopeptide repeat protein [Gammaproteobacteria bacterium]